MERTYGAATKLLMHNSTKTCVNVGMGTVVTVIRDVTSKQCGYVLKPQLGALHMEPPC